MPDKWSPRGRTRYPSLGSEKRDPRDSFIGRLGRLGASEDEIEQFLLDIDDPVDPADRDALLRANDGMLAFEIEALRGGADEVPVDTAPDTVTVGVEPDPPAPVSPTPEPDVVVPADLLDRNIGEVLRWVDADPAARAPIAADLESGRPEPRRTLLARLEGLADGAAG